MVALRIICVLFFLFFFAPIRSTLMAGDVESFNSRLFDLLYFTRPFERAAVAGGAWEGTEGSAASAIQNPAGLAHIRKPELLSYWTYNYIEGATYGLEGVVSSGPGGSVQKLYEKPVARLSNMGVYQVFRPGLVPGSVGIGIDYLWNDLSGNDVSRVDQYGFRAGFSYGLPISDKVSLGYGLTYLYDAWQWTVTWARFTPGNPIPSNIDCMLKSKGNSWRHRIGLQASPWKTVRLGIEGELGHGHTNNRWNGTDYGGGNTMRHYGARAGAEYDILPDLTALAEMEWHSTKIEFGHHSPIIGGSGAVAQWDTDALRYMFGIKYRVTESLKLLGGYRYSAFNTGNLCHNNADDVYNTFSLGAAYSITRNMNLLWNIEYSTTEPKGEFMNVLSFKASF